MAWHASPRNLCLGIGALVVALLGGCAADPAREAELEAKQARALSVPVAQCVRHVAGQPGAAEALQSQGYAKEGETYLRAVPEFDNALSAPGTISVRLEPGRCEFRTPVHVTLLDPLGQRFATALRREGFEPLTGTDAQGATGGRYSNGQIMLELSGFSASEAFRGFIHTIRVTRV